MTLLTFVTPVGPYHLHLVERARASVEAQTIPCEFIYVIDVDRRGAGWARNRGLEQVTTPFVSFLDADDIVEPDYAERMLAAYEPGKYTYCNSVMHEKDGSTYIREYLPCCVPSWRCHHSITAVVRTDSARAIMFDEQRGHSEDTLFWLKLVNAGTCPKHVPYPLFHYMRGDGVRHTWAENKPYWRMIFNELFEEYPDMGCCGGSGKRIKKLQPGDETKQEGDILVQTLWSGNRSTIGKITGRTYPRSGNGKQLWIDERDYYVSKELYRRIERKSELIKEQALSPDAQAELDRIKADIEARRAKAEAELVIEVDVPDIDSMTRNQMIALAEENDVDINKRARAEDMRTALRTALDV